MKYDRTPDKEMKFKNDYNIKVFKTLTEDKGGPVETMILYDSDGREICKLVKKDGKLNESAATTDAQDSGIYADFAKKFGIKEKDLIYTQSSAAAAQMAVEEDKMKKSGGLCKNSSSLNLLRSMKNKNLQKSPAQNYTPEKIYELKMQNRPVNHGLELVKKIKQIKDSNKQSDPSSPEMLEQKVRSKYGLDKADGEPRTLDYSKFNSNKTKEPANTLDYSKMEAPAKIPKWKRDANASQYQKQQTMIGNAGGLKTKVEADRTKMKKNSMMGYGQGADSGSPVGIGAAPSTLAMSKNKLKKDVVDIKTRKKLGETGGDKPVTPSKPKMDTRSRDQKIKDALSAQGAKGSPYAFGRRSGDVGSSGAKTPPKPNMKGIDRDKIGMDYSKESPPKHAAGITDKADRLRSSLERINKFMAEVRSKSADKTEKSKPDLNKAGGIPKQKIDMEGYRNTLDNKAYSAARAMGHDHESAINQVNKKRAVGGRPPLDHKQVPDKFPKPDLNKAGKLQKDVIDIKTRKKIGDTAGSSMKPEISNKPKIDTRSTDQKIGDAPNRQSKKGNPYESPGPGGGPSSIKQPSGYNFVTGGGIEESTARMKNILDKLNKLRAQSKNDNMKKTSKNASRTAILSD